MLAANTLMRDVKKKENHKNTRLIFPGCYPDRYRDGGC
jgi:hypothetical protein